jgi:hypothetical protein
VKIEKRFAASRESLRGDGKRHCLVGQGFVIKLSCCGEVVSGHQGCEQICGICLISKYRPLFSEMAAVKVARERSPFICEVFSGFVANWKLEFQINLKIKLKHATMV